MQRGTHKDQNETIPTLLELLLRLEGVIRRRLEPIRVTPLQAGVILFLRRHAEARVTDAATALGGGERSVRIEPAGPRFHVEHSSQSERHMCGGERPGGCLPLTHAGNRTSDGRAGGRTRG